MSHPSNGDDPDDEPGGGTPGPSPKPDELLRLHRVTAELFSILRDWFGIEDHVTLDLTEIDSAVAELGDPQMVIALAMRKLQALHLLATPGVRTTTDVVVAIVNDLERAMVQAPNMWLKRRAATTDWDDEFAAITGALDDPEADDAEPDASGSDDDHDDLTADDGSEAVGSAALPRFPDDGDDVAEPVDAIERFRYLHSQLHDAMFAVIEVSGGEISELE